MQCFSFLAVLIYLCALICKKGFLCSDPNFFLNSIFENLHHKKGLKGEISIDADSGPPRYVL